jgi:hypothetical protein
LGYKKELLHNRSMINIPHNFPSLRNGPRKPVLICGSGMSNRLAPSLADVKEQCVDAERKLNCSIPRNDGGSDKPEYLYAWAEQIYQQLQDRQEPLPKLKMAKALGLLDNLAWLGKVEVPLRGNWPRHRVIARFARENRWHAIWSLNWDCLLEVGLESVGFDENPIPTQQPWPTTYVTYITVEDARASADDNTVTVYKPHGCIKSLITAQEENDKGNHERAKSLAERFVITKPELEELEQKCQNSTGRSLYFRLHSHLESCPLVSVGWSVSEDYFVDLVRQALGPQTGTTGADELTIVDVVFNEKGHKQLAECYGCDKAKAHVEVSKGPQGLTTDRLFLWIQALYALECLKRHSRTYSNNIQDIYDRFQRPVLNDFVVDWVDDFLPAWVRLCWRAGLVTYINGGRQIPRHSIRMEKPDEHIPWQIKGIKRPDLLAAAHLLTRIGKNAQRWDYRKFPGGLWKSSKGLLVIPLPAWGDSSDLSGLSPLLKRMEQDIGYVRELRLLPLHYDSTKQITDDTVSIMRRQVATLTRKIQFASVTGGIEHVKIQSIDTL